VATPGQWVAGARVKTLPAAVVPVAVGTAVASFSGTELDSPQFVVRSLLALIVSLALQIGVNYANDYSDGIRGTDENRVGPIRLVGQGLVPPSSVKKAAFAAFGVASLAGLVLVVLTQAWWLIAVGLVAILAAWFYTGGPKPYGYSGLGEVMVFVFFGPVAVVGTTFVLTESFRLLSLILSTAVGLFACALLVVNNLRDIPTDMEARKLTLAVRLGDAKTRTLYGWCIAAPFGIVAVVGIGGIGFIDFLPAGAIFPLVSIPLAVIPWRRITQGARGPALVQVLVETGRVQLAFGLLLALGVALSR